MEENKMNDDFELSWDSVISQDAEEFPILPAGVYAYEIINMERGRRLVERWNFE